MGAGSVRVRDVPRTVQTRKGYQIVTEKMCAVCHRRPGEVYWPDPSNEGEQRIVCGTCDNVLADLTPTQIEQSLLFGGRA